MKAEFKNPDLGFIQRSIAFIRSVWPYVSSKRNDAYVRDFGAEIMYTLKMMWKHGVIILLMMIPVALLLSMPQGKDLLYNMLFDDGVEFVNVFLRVLWFLLMLVFTTYTIWAIPRFYQDYEETQKDKTVFTSTSGNFIRILSTAPFVVYGLALFLIEPRCEIRALIYWPGILLLGLLILLLSVHLRYGKISFCNLLILGSVTAILLPIGYTLVYHENAHKEWALIILGNGLLLLGGISYVLLMKWEEKFEEYKLQEDRIRILKKKGDRVYRWVMILSFAVMLIFSLIRDMTYVTSVSLLTQMMACLILWFNWLSYQYKTFEGWKQFALFILIIALLVYLNYPPSKPHRVHLVDCSLVSDRPDFDQYLKQWIMQRDSLFESSFAKGDSLPIYLIAGEGGGSRAGLWYASYMLEMDELTGGKFSRQTFASSTVSGSSVGASLLSKWYRVCRDRGLDRASDKRADSLAYHFFTNNFVSGSLFDLFFLDFVRKFHYKPTRSGRNLRLQEEENVAYLRAMEGSSAEAKDMTPSIRGSAGNKVKMDKQDSIANYHFMPIQDLWLDETGSPILDIPLNFFNTTHMATVRQYALAPVSFDFDVHKNESIDLISILKQRDSCINQKYDIALGTASNMSEMFPFFSAYSHVDKIGMFMDGGGSDNSGAHTLSLIYNRLQHYLDTLSRDSIDYKKRYPIVVLYLSNDNPEAPDQDLENKKAKSQLRSLLGLGTALPFQNITPQSIRNLEKAVKQNGNRYIEASWSSFNRYEPCPHGCKDSLQVRFPTARSLTAKNRDDIIHFSKAKARQVCGILMAENLLPR